MAVLTRSEAGSVIVAKGETISIPAEAVNQVVDVTGAGDLYAAGFLFGLTKGLPLEACGRLGSLAASEAIGHLGARPGDLLAQARPVARIDPIDAPPVWAPPCCFSATLAGNRPG